MGGSVNHRIYCLDVGFSAFGVSQPFGPALRPASCVPTDSKHDDDGGGGPDRLRKALIKGGEPTAITPAFYPVPDFACELRVGCDFHFP